MAHQMRRMSGDWEEVVVGVGSAAEWERVTALGSERAMERAVSA